jgi:hypothetical protein
VLIRTVLGAVAVSAIIIGIILLATFLGGITLAEYLTQTAAALTVAACGIIYWMFKPQIDRRVSNKYAEVKPKGRLISSSEAKVDDLVKEIEDFITNWREGSGILDGYRAHIEQRKMLWYRGKIKEHSTKIRKKIRPLRKVPDSRAVLDSLGAVLDKMFVYGREIESIFASNLPQDKLSRIEQTEIDRLVTEGDNICKELEGVVLQLEKFR